MAIQIVTPTPSAFNNTTANQPSYTYNFTCPAGTILLLVLVHSFNTFDISHNDSMTSATYNAKTVTIQTGDGQQGEDTRILSLQNPDTGAAHDLVVNFSPNCPFGVYMQAYCISGNDTTTPINQSNKGSRYQISATSPGTDSLSPAAASDSLVFDAVMCNFTTTPDASQTSLYSATWGGDLPAASDKTGGVSAMSWTFSGTVRFAHSWVEVKAAGSAYDPSVTVPSITPGVNAGMIGRTARGIYG